MNFRLFLLHVISISISKRDVRIETSIIFLSILGKPDVLNFLNDFRTFRLARHALWFLEMSTNSHACPTEELTLFQRNLDEGYRAKITLRCYCSRLRKARAIFGIDLNLPFFTRRHRNNPNALWTRFGAGRQFGIPIQYLQCCYSRKRMLRCWLPTSAQPQ